MSFRYPAQRRARPVKNPESVIGLAGSLHFKLQKVARRECRKARDRQHQMAKAAMTREKISYEEARARQVDSIAAKRLGDPKEFGTTCAFLCSVFAGFMSGQNLHLDGGSYPALV